MGSYSQLRLGSLYLGWEKNDIDPGIMKIFRESDKRIVLADRTQLGELQRQMSYGIGGYEPVTLVLYACSALAARDRLDLMGFTRKVAEAGFYQGLQKNIARIAFYEERVPGGRGSIFKERLQLLRELTLEDWLGTMQQILQKGLTPSLSRTDSDCSEYSPLLRYMLCEEGHNWYGFP